MIKPYENSESKSHLPREVQRSKLAQESLGECSPEADQRPTYGLPTIAEIMSNRNRKFRWKST